MLDKWAGVLNRAEIELCYWILNKKVNLIVLATLQHLTDDKWRDPISNIQQRIRNYHALLEASLRSDDFLSSLSVYDEFINDDEESVAKVYTNEEEYQRLTNYIDLNDVIDNINELKAADLYDQ